MERASIAPLLGDVVSHPQPHKSINSSEVPYLEDSLSRSTSAAIWQELEEIWSLAGPVAFARLSTYGFGVITQAYAGRFGTLELAAVAMANSTLGGLSFALMVGMSSGLQTLCGQAFGAQKFEMLGIYLQQSFIVMNGLAVLLTVLYVFAAPLLKAIGQPAHLADLTGKFVICLIPQVFAYANYYSVQKYLQSQRKVKVQALICAGSLVCHVFLNWLFIAKLGFGLLALAMILNATWWLVVTGQLIYVVSGAFPTTWTGFSWAAFHDLWRFLKLSVSSAVMMCLELWYYRFLVLLTGSLRNPEIAVDSISICLSVYEWLMMINIALYTTTGVRVSNELGAGRPKSAKFVVQICVGIAISLGIIFFTCILIARNEIAPIFTSNSSVRQLVYELSIFLACTVLINSMQPTLSGVAVGAGWQSFVAKVNIACYYFIGVPVGFLLGLETNMHVKGIWTGLMVGTASQTLVLALTTYRVDWNREVGDAMNRVRVG